MTTGSGEASSVLRRIVDRCVLHLIKMWLECPVEETDDRGRKTRTTEARPGFVLELQPPAQPHRCVAVECPIRLADGAYLEVVRPSAQRAVHLVHQLCGFLPCPHSVCQCMDLLNHALDALLRWPVSQARLTGSR